MPFQVEADPTGVMGNEDLMVGTEGLDEFHVEGDPEWPCTTHRRRPGAEAPDIEPALPDCSLFTPHAYSRTCSESRNLISLQLHGPLVGSRLSQAERSRARRVRAALRRDDQ